MKHVCYPIREKYESDADILRKECRIILEIRNESSSKNSLLAINLFPAKRSSLKRYSDAGAF